jgi:hypothetical protein
MISINSRIRQSCGQADGMESVMILNTRGVVRPITTIIHTVNVVNSLV